MKSSNLKDLVRLSTIRRIEHLHTTKMTVGTLTKLLFTQDAIRLLNTSTRSSDNLEAHQLSLCSICQISQTPHIHSNTQRPTHTSHR